MTNLHARFWKYTGTDHNGRDQERKDPHGFGLDVISYLARVGSWGDYQKPLTYEDVKRIQVKNFRGDRFGHEVQVSAPKEVWKKAKIAQEVMLETIR